MYYDALWRLRAWTLNFVLSQFICLYSYCTKTPHLSLAAKIQNRCTKMLLFSSFNRKMEKMVKEFASLNLQHSGLKASCKIYWVLPIRVLHVSSYWYCNKLTLALSKSLCTDTFVFPFFLTFSNRCFSFFTVLILRYIKKQ